MSKAYFYSKLVFWFHSTKLFKGKRRFKALSQSEIVITALELGLIKEVRGYYEFTQRGIRTCNKVAKICKVC